jgi:hypothetical protein
MNAEPASRQAIASRGDFVAAARELLLQADQSLTRDITLIDTDFSPWPLDEPAVVDALTRWARLPGRRLRLVGSRFDIIEREQPRFAAWRKPFAHAVECVSPIDVAAADMPSVLLFDATCVELLDREHWQARCSSERRTIVMQRERLDALLQRCEAAWPITMLGL